MDIIRLYADYTVECAPEDHKHTRPGWVNTECPFCTGNPGYHLGYNLQGDYFFCWRCGWHPTVNSLIKVLRLPEPEVRKLVRAYGLRLSKIEIHKVVHAKTLQLPTGITELTEQHQQYLRSRNFDPQKLQQIWGLKSTGPVSYLQKHDYKHRILIPFTWDRQMVSFDTRTQASGVHDKRYKACPEEYEVISHKDILYGLQEEWRDVGFCVEGPTDVWRLGTVAFATSGIQFTWQQLRTIANTFRQIVVIYDNEKQAQVQAKKLIAELKFRGVDAVNHVLTTANDPGSLRQDEANELIKKYL